MQVLEVLIELLMRVNVLIKIEMQYIPFNLLHLLSLKITSILIVLVACLLFIHNSIDLPTFIMISIFSFVILIVLKILIVQHTYSK